MSVIDLDCFKRSFLSFPANYMLDFDCFWRWKLKIETEDGHVLDENHQGETYHKLSDILASWQAYRSSRNYAPWVTLKHSLEAISDAYNKIRTYSLLECDKISSQSLELIWHELGRVKEYDGNKNDMGSYYIISVCKPLMLLWGQTLAFDSRVRAHVPYRYNFVEKTRWTFREWMVMIKRFQEVLRQDSMVVSFFKKEALKRYGSESIVPYGRFLDIYYF